MPLIFTLIVAKISSGIIGFMTESLFCCPKFIYLFFSQPFFVERWRKVDLIAILRAFVADSKR